MSLHFSANQYERNFKPTLLQNWEVPRQYREKMEQRGLRNCRPRAFIGFTQLVANDRGHLLPGVKRSRESPWGAFVGTWDLPIRIPGNNMMNSTARTVNALQRLERIKTDGDIVLGGKLKQCKVPLPLPVKADVDADKTLSPKAAQGATQLTSPGNGERSGARNPEPKSSVDVPGSPGIRTPIKPSTPNITWPQPVIEGSRAKSASPKAGSPLPPITSPKTGAPAPAQDLKWPSPRADEQPAAV